MKKFDYTDTGSGFGGGWGLSSLIEEEKKKEKETPGKKFIYPKKIDIPNIAGVGAKAEGTATLKEPTQKELLINKFTSMPDKPTVGGMVGISKPLEIKKEANDPTWGEVVSNSLKAGLASYQGNLFNIARLVQTGAVKATDKITDIFDKDWYDPKNDFILNQLTKIVEDSEKIATESTEQAEAKNWLKKFIGTGLHSTPQILGSWFLGGGVPTMSALKSAGYAPKVAEFIDSARRMIPFGLGATGGYSRQAEKEFNEIGKEAPYFSTLLFGILSGTAEVASEMPVFIGVSNILKGKTKLVNEGAKTLVSKYGKGAYEIGKNMVLQAAQEAEIEPIVNAAARAIGLEREKIVDIKAMGEAAYGGLAMAVVTGGIGGAVATGTKASAKIAEDISQSLEQGEIKKALEIITNESGFIRFGRGEEDKAVEKPEQQPAEPTKPVAEVPSEESIETSVKNIRSIPDNIMDGWFRDYDIGYKPKLVNILKDKPEIKNSALNIFLKQYREFTGLPLSFNEFINTPITLYRAGGIKNDEEFNSFTLDKEIANQFSDKRDDKEITEIQVKPKDTYGMFQTTGELEVLVPTDKINQATGKTAKVEKIAGETTEKPEKAPEQPISEGEKGDIAKETTETEIPKDTKIKDVYDIGENITGQKVKSIILKNTGVKTEPKIIEVKDNIALKESLRKEQKGSKTGFKVGKQEAKAELGAKAKARAYVGKLIKNINKLPTQNMPVDYKENIQAIQDEFDLKKRTAKTLIKRQKLADFIQRETEQNHEVDVPQEHIDMIRKTPLNDMTIQELETLHDELQHIAHLGKVKDRLLKIADKRAIGKQVDTLVDTVTKGKGITFDESVNIGREDKNFFQRGKEVVQTYHYNTMRAERLFEQLDNYKEGGEWWKTFYQPINDATYQEMDNYNTKLDEFKQFIEDTNINVDKLIASRVEIKGSNLPPMSPSERIEVYLATSDKDKLRHLIKGNKFTEKQIDDVVNDLTPKEKKLADYLLKHYEEQYKGINDIYRQLKGKNLPKIPGYSPIRIRGKDINVSQDYIENLLTQYNTRPSIGKNFTKERTKGATQPINLDAINNFLFNLNRVEHYKAFVMPIRDVNKLLSEPKITEAIKQKKGEVFYNNLKGWLLDVSDTGHSRVFDDVDKTAMLLRTRAADAMLGFNVVAAMKQPLSLLNASAEIGITNVLNGISQMTHSPKVTTEFVYSKSPMVKNRKGQFDRVIAEYEQSKNIKQVLKGSLTKSDVITGMIKFMDQQSVKAVWKGAYDQAMAKDMTDKQAIEYADRVVRKTQPMAGVKDLPKFFRGSTFTKMFTMFQNQVNNNYNFYAHDILGKTKAGEQSYSKAAYKVLFSYILPALLMGIVSRGRLPKDIKEVAKDLGTFPIAGLFFVGGLVRQIVEGWDGISIPALSWYNDVVSFAKVKTLETKLKYALSATAKVLGIPWNQPYRTWQGIKDFIGDNTNDLRRLIWSGYTLKSDGTVKPPIRIDSLKTGSSVKKFDYKSTSRKSSGKKFKY